MRLYLSDVKLENLLEVHWLRYDEQVKGPRAAKVGNDYGVNRHGREERFPWCRPEVGDALLYVRQRVLDVAPLFSRDRRVLARLFE